MGHLCVWLKGGTLTTLLPTAQSRSMLTVAPPSSASPSPHCLPTDARNEPGYELAFKVTLCLGFHCSFSPQIPFLLLSIYPIPSQLQFPLLQGAFQDYLLMTYDC